MPPYNRGGKLLCGVIPHRGRSVRLAYKGDAGQILIDASNGASDYGNKFGEPLLGGYTRTFGLRLPSGERREWIKPIMFRWAPGDAFLLWALSPLICESAPEIMCCHIFGMCGLE